MFEGIAKFFKKITKKEQEDITSKEAAKERLHLVLMQDRANVSADFLEMMKQEIIEVIKKYIDVDEKDIDVRLTNKTNEDGTTGAPALYANIPIAGIKEDIKTNEKNIKEEIKPPKIVKNDEVESEKIEKENLEKENLIKEDKDSEEEVNVSDVEPKKENTTKKKTNKKKSNSKAEVKSDKNVEDKEEIEKKEDKEEIVKEKKDLSTSKEN